MSKKPKIKQQKISYPNFRNNDAGLFFNKHVEAKPIRIGGPIYIKASYRTESSSQQTIEYEFIDQSGKKIRASIARAEAFKGGTLVTALVGAGYDLDPTVDEKLVAKYFLDNAPKDVITLSPRIAWHGDEFLWPKRTIEHKGERFKYRASKHAHTIDLTQNGDIGEWNMDVWEASLHSRALIFGICASFGALGRRKFTKLPGGGFHFYGQSSIGKTSVLDVAYGVIGQPSRDRLFTWDATDTGMEETAKQHNAILLCLDETGKLQGKGNAEKAALLEDRAYRLSGSRGRTRSTQHSKADLVHDDTAPDVLYLSTGERSIRDIIQAAGREPLPGVQVRQFNIAVGAMGSPWGIFDSLDESVVNLDLPEQEKSRLMVNDIQESASCIYGVAGREFTKWISENPKTAKESFHRYMKIFLDEPSAHEEAMHRRMKDLFSLVYAGGMLAMEALVIFPYPGYEDVILDAVKWGYEAAIADMQKPQTILIDNLTKLKEYCATIAAVEGSDFLSVLQKHGGFVDDRNRYDGCVLLKYETLVNILNGKTPATHVMDVLDEKGCLRGEFKPGEARTIQYNRLGQRLRVVAIDVNRLAAL